MTSASQRCVDQASCIFEWSVGSICSGGSSSGVIFDIRSQAAALGAYSQVSSIPSSDFGIVDSLGISSAEGKLKLMTWLQSTMSDTLLNDALARGERVVHKHCLAVACRR